MRSGQPGERPQLPVIPLGIDADAFQPVCSRREAETTRNPRMQLLSYGLVVSNYIAKRTTAAVLGLLLMQQQPTLNDRGCC